MRVFNVYGMAEVYRITTSAHFLPMPFPYVKGGEFVVPKKATDALFPVHTAQKTTEEEK